MRKILSLIVASILCSGSLMAQSSKQITVTGKVKFPDPTGKYQIYLGQYVGDGFKREFKAIDSTALDANNSFQFKVKTDKPDFYQIRVYYMDRIDFWADKDDLKISFRGIDTAKRIVKNPPHIRIEGSVDNDVINQVNFASYRNTQQMIAVGKEIYAASKSKDSLWNDYMKDGYSKLSDDLDDRIKYIIEMYKDKPTVLYAFNFLSQRKHGEYIMQTLDQIIAKNPKLTQAKKLKEELVAAKAQADKIANGKPAPDFAYPDINGKKFGPQNFRGKYLIVDFWASWCGPCRTEIPHLKEVYKKYKDKGLEILAVSVDAVPEKWKKAMDEEKMAWPQINAQESKPVMDSYLFSGIPYLVLIDKEGRIIEKHLRGESLDKKLKEVFGI